MSLLDDILSQAQKEMLRRVVLAVIVIMIAIVIGGVLLVSTGLLFELSTWTRWGTRGFVVVLIIAAVAGWVCLRKGGKKSEDKSLQTRGLSGYAPANSSLPDTQHGLAPLPVGLDLPIVSNAMVPMSLKIDSETLRAEVERHMATSEWSEAEQLLTALEQSCAEDDLTFCKIQREQIATKRARGL